MNATLECQNSLEMAPPCWDGSSRRSTFKKSKLVVTVCCNLYAGLCSQTPANFWHNHLFPFIPFTTATVPSHHPEQDRRVREPPRRAPGIATAPRAWVGYVRHTGGGGVRPPPAGLPSRAGTGATTPVPGPRYQTAGEEGGGAQAPPLSGGQTEQPAGLCHSFGAPAQSGVLGKVDIPGTQSMV